MSDFDINHFMNQVHWVIDHSPTLWTLCRSVGVDHQQIGDDVIRTQHEMLATDLRPYVEAAVWVCQSVPDSGITEPMGAYFVERIMEESVWMLEDLEGRVDREAADYEPQAGDIEV